MGKLYGRLILLLFLVCSLLLCSQAAARPLLRVGVHELGTDITEDEYGNFYGMDTDFMQALGSYAGRQVIFVPGSWQENQARLASGEIDVVAGIIKTPERQQTMLFSHLMMGRIKQEQDSRISSSPFWVEPLYFAVRRDNTALMNELELANEQLIGNRPYFVSYLYRLYYGQQSSHKLQLAPQEASFLKMHPVISAAVIADERPFAYVDEHGELQGTMRRLTDRIEQDLGIKLSLIIETNYEKAYEDLNSGKAQILLNTDGDISWAAAHGLDLTTSYLTSYYTAVTRREGIPDNPRIACFCPHIAERFLRQRYSEKQLRMYDSIESCLQAVQTKQADMTFLRLETAQYNIWQGNFPDLKTDGSIAFSRDIAIGVSNQMEPELLPILDKEIGFIGRDALLDQSSFYNPKTEAQRSFKSLFFAYPQYFVTGLSLLLLILLLLFWRQMKMRRQHTDELQKMLDTDHYTGLHNRGWFERKAGRYLAAQPESRDFAIIKFGISRPDILVNTYGAEVIFHLLQRFTDNLQQAAWAKFPAVHTSVGKLFFLADLRHFQNQEELEQALRYLLHQNEYINVGHMVVHVDFKIGICSLSSHNVSMAKAMNQADFALHEAQPICFYNAEIQQKTELLNRIEGLQQKAMANKEFKVWYQPKYDLKTRRCVGAEALVRWQSRELGFLPPGQFIPLFERNGFITQLDFFMLGQVMTWQKKRRLAGLPVVPVSVNQSRLHLQEKNYLTYMQRLVTYYSAKDIELELTETAFSLQEPKMQQQALNVGRRLQEMGFCLDIDDFGSGYSNLTLLNAMPFRVIKIDRSLLLAAEGSPRMQTVLAHTCKLGHDLGMTIICEGIETPEQEEILRRCGCDQGQGYLYGKPMKEADFEAFLAAHI
ncbi:EAL domain-containing protein [Mitsuokella sp.]|uniref:EAL domain-containing protein n=1 Tax=Mitsuokella sp. TaxID=2049034 RepID=UPI003D7C5175